MTATTLQKEATQTTDTDHQLYEIAYILDGNLNEEKTKETAGSLRSVLEKKNAIFIEDNAPKLRKLAYPFGKQTSGFFGWMKFLVQPSDIKDIEKQIKRIPEITRMLIMKSYREALMERRTKIRKRVETEEEKGRIEEIDKKLEEILGE